MAQVPIQDLLPIISRCPLLHGLTPTECQTFAEHGRQIEVTKDAYFFHEGHPTAQFYILLSGEVKLTQLTKEGQQVIINYLSPGAGFGIIVVLGQTKYPVTAVAVQTCLALAWDRQITTTLMLQYPRLALNGMEMIARRFVALQERYRELATERVEQRIAHVILRLVRQFGTQIDDGILINMPISHQDLADMTGTTIYTVSRVLRKWEQQGIVKIGRQRLILLQLHQLVTVADGLTP